MRYGLLAGNAALLVVVALFVVRSQSGASVDNLVSVAKSADSGVVADPLDQLSSADIAVNVARVTNLPEATAVTNQADSVNAELAITQNADSLVAKPQVVATSFKSNQDIQIYFARSGDTVASIAAKFNVTSDSIRWSNNLEGSTVMPGQKLYIPPVNGIVYVVKAGDTPASLAAAYGANKQLIIAYNDAELTGLKPGELIIIPNGQPGDDNGGSNGDTAVSTGGFPWGTGPVYGYNGYDYGFCTWYVASQIAVPSNWGNASSWSYYAALSGWTVSSVPSVGAIAQTPYAAGGEGHVAIVDAVNANGTEIKYRDMNGLAGWGAVGYSGWVSASTFPNYITH